jgi:hypothetical protein
LAKVGDKFKVAFITGVKPKDAIVLTTHVLRTIFPKRVKLPCKRGPVAGNHQITAAVARNESKLRINKGSEQVKSKRKSERADER